MATFTIGSYDYKSSPMDAMTQLHVVRRMSPAVGAMTDIMPAIGLFVGKDEDGNDREFDKDLLMRVMMTPSTSPDAEAVSAHQEAINKAVEALGKALGSLSEADTNYIIAAALKLCERRAVGNNASWSQVWNANANRPQHADINAVKIMQIAWAVLSAELSSFFPGRPSKSEGA